MEIEYGTPIVDKNDREVGTVDHIINDMWSGEPRKYVVRLGDDISAAFFTPENIAQTTGERVKLNLSLDEMEKT